MNGSEDEISSANLVEITPELLETTRKEIEEDQQSWVESIREKEDPNDRYYTLRPSDEDIKWDDYFNNWHDYLPGSFLRRQTEKLGVLDTRNPADYPGHTNLVAGRSFREINESIDRAIDEEGLDHNTIKELLERIEENNTERTRIAVNKYTFPAFVRLRAQGYNWYDLTE